MYTTSGYLLTDNNPFVPSNKNENEKSIEKIERKDEKEDYSNGRFDRWNAGFEAFKTTPVIGTSPRNTVSLSKDRTDVGKYELITHCSYLEILVDTGVVGAITMYSGLIYIVVKIIKASMKNKLNAECLATVACILSCALGALFISDIFFVFTINSFVFFYMLGYLYGTAEDNKSGVVYKIFTSIFKKRAAKEAQPGLKDSQNTHEC